MDRDLLASYVEQGFSAYTIGKKYNKSPTTIRYWLKKYNLKTKNKSFKDGYHHSNIEKVNIQNQFCSICNHKLTIKNAYFRKDRKIYYPKCKNCFSKETKYSRKNNKQKAIEHKGGCCNRCGYNKCIRALEFHHLDPDKKSKGYNRNFKLWNFERQKKELENCILVCSNCHREIHNQ